MSPERRRRIIAAIVLGATIVASLHGCSDDRPETQRREEMKTRRPISEILKDHAGALMKIEGVVGVYEGRLENGEACITVMVKSDRPGLTTDIPSLLGGYPVQIEIGGEIRPMR